MLQLFVVVNASKTSSKRKEGASMSNIDYDLIDKECVDMVKKGGLW